MKKSKHKKAIADRDVVIGREWEDIVLRERKVSRAKDDTIRELKNKVTGAESVLDLLGIDILDDSLGDKVVMWEYRRKWWQI